MTTIAEQFFNPRTATPWRIVSWPVSLFATKMVISQLQDIPPKAKVLDVGVGTGATASRLARALSVRVDGVDASQAMLDIARTVVPDNAKLFRANASRLPFESNVYDASIYNYVLRYIEPQNAEAVISEAVRVTKHDGRVIITDLNLPRLRPGKQSVEESLDFNILGVWAKYSRKEFIEHVKSLGLVHEKTLYPPFSFMLIFRKAR